MGTSALGANISNNAETINSVLCCLIGTHYYYYLFIYLFSMYYYFSCIEHYGKFLIGRNVARVYQEI